MIIIIISIESMQCRLNGCTASTPGHALQCTRVIICERTACVANISHEARQIHVNFHSLPTMAVFEYCVKGHGTRLLYTPDIHPEQ